MNGGYFVAWTLVTGPRVAKLSSPEISLSQLLISQSKALISPFFSNILHYKSLNFRSLHVYLSLMRRNSRETETKIQLHIVQELMFRGRNVHATKCPFTLDYNDKISNETKFP